jgi:hypothetical protein
LAAFHSLFQFLCLQKSQQAVVAAFIQIILKEKMLTGGQENKNTFMKKPFYISEDARTDLEWMRQKSLAGTWQT